MVDFDAAVAAVQDPNADPRVSGENRLRKSEFGANVVANPRAYPGLKRWVAQFGDERARQHVVAMGWPVPQDGIMQQEAETRSEQTHTRCQANRRNTSSRSNHRKCNIRRSTSRRQPSNASLSRLRQHLHRIWRTMLRRNTSTHITTPADLSEVADFSPIQPQEPVASNAGFTRNWP